MLKLREWAEGHSDPHRLLDLLREANELKKLNGNLLKQTAIDDLISDMFARLYEEVIPGLLEESNESSDRPQTSRDRMSVDNLMNMDGVADVAKADQEAPVQVSTKQRFKAITKRELLRKVDLLLGKPTTYNLGPATRMSRGEEAIRGVAPPQPQSHHGGQHHARDPRTPEEDVIVVATIADSQPGSPVVNNNNSDAGDEGGSDDDADDEGQGKSPAPEETDLREGNRVDSPAVDLDAGRAKSVAGTEDEGDDGHVSRPTPRDAEVATAEDDDDGDENADDKDEDDENAPTPMEE